MSAQRKSTGTPVGSLAEALLQRHGLLEAGKNLHRLPERHPQHEHCAQHGRYPTTTLDAQGAVRYIVPTGCPKCRIERRLEALLSRAAIPQRYQQCDFGNYHVSQDSQKLALQTCRDFAEAFAQNTDGRGLILLGNPGTGKNHLAAAIARHLLAQGRTVLQTTVWELVDRIRETWGRQEGPTEREVIRSFAGVDLLILDEVGKQHGSDSERVSVFAVLDSRYRECRPTVLLSNESLAGLEDYLGAAAFDRLCHRGTLVQCHWPSFRRRKS